MKNIKLFWKEIRLPKMKKMELKESSKAFIMMLKSMFRLKLISKSKKLELWTKKM